eukprot:1768523-Prorocentrum_lima.AAC.1
MSLSEFEADRDVLRPNSSGSREAPSGYGTPVDRVYWILRSEESLLGVAKTPAYMELFAKAIGDVSPVQMQQIDFWRDAQLLDDAEDESET